MKKQYVDIQKHWRKLRPYARSAEATKIWKRDLKKYHTAYRVYGLRLDNETFDTEWFNKILPSEECEDDRIPADYDLSSWRYDGYRVGRKPAYWDYVVAGKCHWMVNLNLFLANNAFKKEVWRIIANKEHSCIWNGSDLLFDLNYSALVPDVTKHPFYGKFDSNVKVFPVGEEYIFNITDADVRILDDYDAGLLSLTDIEAYFLDAIKIWVNRIEILAALAISAEHSKR